MKNEIFQPFQQHLDHDKTQKLLRKILRSADDGEIFFEEKRSESLVLDDQTLKSANLDASKGFGVRAVKGEATAYAHSTDISLFVTLLLGYVIIKFNRKANPEPASFTHNTPVEVAWTVVPIVILVFIGAFSLPVLFKQQVIPDGDINIKVTGNQWYWGYEYTDHGFGFDSMMIGDDKVLTSDVEAELIEAGYSRNEFLLATDTAVVVPVDKVVVMQVTGADVIHSWTIPAFGVKQDAVPGRLGQLWFKAEKEGVYFGQCSELCGKDHAYMPITVKVVSQENYEAWLSGAIEEFAGLTESNANLELASVD